MFETVVGRRRAGGRAVRKVALTVWLGASGVQVAVWVLVCALNQRLVSPWWLWTAGTGGLLVAAVWWLTGPRRDAHRAPASNEWDGENGSW